MKKNEINKKDRNVKVISLGKTAQKKDDKI
jgi:hypothetical protein